MTVNNVTNFECQVKTDVNGVYRRTLSARLFPHFEPKKRFLKKVRCKIAFGYVKTQLFDKSCVFGTSQKRGQNVKNL